MSGLKRKRGDAIRGCRDGGNADSDRGITDTDAGALLERTLAELRSSTKRIETLVHTVRTTTPRSPLMALRAPVQPTHASGAPPRLLAQCSCSCSCSELQAQLAALREQVAQHTRDRQAWKAFKAWWLDSLAKRQRRASRAKMSKRTPTEHANMRQSALHSMVAKLDEQTKRIWLDAGIVSREQVGEVDQDSSVNEAGQDDRQVQASNVQRATNEVISAHVSHQQSDCNANGTNHQQRNHQQRPCHPETPNSASDTACQPTGAVHRQHPRHLAQAGATSRTCLDHHRTAGAHIDSTPIRNRVARPTLIASSCPDCSLFYSHLNQLNPPTTQPQRQGDTSCIASSRHRSTLPRATTPDGYWNIAFPDTQQVQHINALAQTRRPPPRRSSPHHLHS